MDRSGSRVALAALTLVGLWIGVYWLWPASEDGAGHEPPITYDDHPPVDPAALGQRPRRPEPAEDGGDTDARVAATSDAPEAADASDSGSSPLDALESAPAPDLAPANPPRFEQYTVRSGDSFPRIAARVYGDESHWRAVAKANPLVDPRQLRVGQVIRVPVDPANVQGGAATADADAGARGPGEATEHVVQPGETLGEIARALYGRSSLWPIIFDANSSRLDLSAPEDLRPGMRLVIPPPPDLAEAGDDQERGA